ncbi:50S ribosomal protein L25/general stress protein Ctc [Actinopolymorpha pittospori]|uniref:Large ribosomal subunit protein bL25 n=1 Tax=Actinopolymorpha pittospori TaxID=648752 RepID=A0A927N3H2_9ACTN|nr:large subunit ribosomal protein L25 [Actinopolymorpha pittospori]
MSEVKIKAESRTEFGKGAARRIRRAGLVPAVLYGHGSAPVHVTLPGHELMLALKTSNALFDVDLGDRSELAIPKQVQRDPIKGFLEHVDLLIVKRGEKVVVEVPVTLVGEAGPGSLVALEHTTLSVETEATHIPSEIQVSIEGVAVGTQILAKDIVLPAGTAMQLDAETLIVNIAAAPTAEQVEGELAEAGAGEAAEAAEAPAAEEGGETAAEGQ